MRMDKKNKKLSLMIGMALSAGICFSMNPMEAYAATSVEWSADDSKYKVTVGSTETEYAQASEAIAAIIKGLNTDADKDITIDLSDSSTWQKDADSKKAAQNLAKALRDQQVTLKDGASVDLTFANGDSYQFTNGSGDNEVTLGADGVLKIGGDMDSVTAKLGGKRTAQIEVADGKTVGTVEVSDENSGTLALIGAGTVSKIDAKGDVTVSAAAGTRIGEIAVADGRTLTASGDISASSITGTGTIDAGSNSLNVSGDITAGSVTAGSVTAGSVTAGSVTADVKADSLNITGSADTTVGGSHTWDVGTLTTDGKLTISDASKLTAKSIESTGDLTLSDTSNTLDATSIKSGGALTILDGAKVTATDISSTGVMTIGNAAGGIAAGANISAGDLTVTAGDLDAGTLTVNGALSTTGSVTADTVKFGSGASIGGSASSDSPVEIKANNIVIDTTRMTKDDVAKLKIASKTDGGSVNVKVVSSDGAISDEMKEAIEKAAGDNTVNISATSQTAEEAKTDADEAIKAADEALKKANPLAAVDPAEIANANPFTTKLPSASEIAALQNLKVDASVTKGLTEAINTLDTEIGNAETAGNTALKAELESKKAELESKAASLSAGGMQAKAAELTAAVQQAGKTAAALGVTSARAATVITNVMTANVTSRTNELRGYAAAVDEGRPAPDNVWFQYKHTNMDVDNGDIYGTSTIKTNNYQLGYDAKVGENDYLGAYIGTTTGSAEFTGPAASDKADIENSIDFGIYGTHMLPDNQYFDYMVHTGKFDNKLYGETWGTKDTGVMLGYGAKIVANDRLTWNPYVQMAYDKVSVDSYMAGQNSISSDDSDNWTAKLGINLLDASGLYGGLAYSRGLSGSYNAYINGVPMPTQDNNANVLYLSLGYRANLNKNVFLDLSMEKTFADYKGWSAAGKINFYF